MGIWTNVEHTDDTERAIEPRQRRKISPIWLFFEWVAPSWNQIRLQMSFGCFSTLFHSVKSVDPCFFVIILINRNYGYTVTRIELLSTAGDQFFFWAHIHERNVNQFFWNILIKCQCHHEFLQMLQIFQSKIIFHTCQLDSIRINLRPSIDLRKSFNNKYCLVWLHISNIYCNAVFELRSDKVLVEGLTWSLSLSQCLSCAPNSGMPSLHVYLYSILEDLSIFGLYDAFNVFNAISPKVTCIHKQNFHKYCHLKLMFCLDDAGNYTFVFVCHAHATPCHALSLGFGICTLLQIAKRRAKLLGFRSSNSLSPDATTQKYILYQSPNPNIISSLFPWRCASQHRMQINSLTIAFEAVSSAHCTYCYITYVIYPNIPPIITMFNNKTTLLAVWCIWLGGLTIASANTQKYIQRYLCICREVLCQVKWWASMASRIYNMQF